MRKILALVLTLLVAIVPVASYAVLAGGNPDDYGVATCADYIPRLTEPSKSNKYYYSNMNILYAAGYGMPNCTAYAWGRAYELLGTQPKLCLNDARNWYGYNKDNKYYPYGKTPKLGAIACWETPTGGHVAVVEEITSTTITFSNSGWGYLNFYLTEAEIDDPSVGIYRPGSYFMGYIYILDGVKEPETPKGDIYRVDSYNGINVRKGAGTSYSVIEAIPYNTEIVVTETKAADGYLWGKTTYAGVTGWCALDFCELIYKKPAETKPTEPETTVPETTVPETTIPETTVPEPTVPETEATLDEPPMFAPAPDFGTPTDPVEKPLGNTDIDNDGITTVKDATVLQKTLTGMDIGISLDNADVDLNGRVNIADVTCIQKFIAAII